MRNIEFKTAECAFTHLFDLRFSFTSMSTIIKYNKKHNNLNQIGRIRDVISDQCRHEFTEHELNRILYFENRTKDMSYEERLEFYNLIKKLDSSIKANLMK